VGECVPPTYPADDIVVVGEMCFAIGTAIDAFRVEVDIVSETHFAYETPSRRLGTSLVCGSLIECKVDALVEIMWGLMEDQLDLGAQRKRIGHKVIARA
jgi:hypothetical protein